MDVGSACFFVERAQMPGLQAQIAAVLAMAEKDHETATFDYFDTSDWRLCQKGLALTSAKGQFSLVEDGGATLCQTKSLKKRRLFCWDLPAGEMRDRLQPLIEVRALLPQFTLNRDCQHYHATNSDGKTVVRLQHITAWAVGAGGTTELPPLLIVEMLRGYDRPYQKVCAIAEEYGLVAADRRPGVVLPVLQGLGLDYEQLTARFTIELVSGLTVAAAFGAIGRALSETMMANFAGMLADVDSEFLHDFRVAVRRTRSLLSLLKGELADDLGHFQSEFKWLFTVTGSLRDLDVYLLEREQYSMMLPPVLHSGLNLFFTGLSQERKNARRKLKKDFKADRFTRLMADWQAFLVGLQSRPADDPSGQDCRQVAERLIRRRHKQILKKGARIDASSPPEALHELRIATKKFRYLLEFFRSLLAVDGVDQYLGHLKKLQNNLGQYNDLAVQQKMLVGHQRSLRGSGQQQLETAAALGGLIVHLATEQRLVRARFDKAYEQFAAPETVDLLAAVFSRKSSSMPTRETAEDEDTGNLQ